MKGNIWFYSSFEDLIINYKDKKGYFIPLIASSINHFEAIIFFNNQGNYIYSEIINFINSNKLMLNYTIFYSIMTEDTKNLELKKIICRFEECKMSDVKVKSISEESLDYSDDSLFNITSWGADLSFRELILMYEDEELIKPELQRKYVWSKEEASRFVDSLLLGLPVPSIFLAKVADQKLIIDGYQRLMTVYDFVNGVFSGDNKAFKLTNSSMINKLWRGKTFAELSKDYQRKILSTTIHAIIFEQKMPKNDSGMYKVFERINTSGRNLKPQEIRNCVYHGSFDSALFEMNDYSSWRKLWGNNAPDSRMTDIEFILRFFSIKNIYVNGTTVKQISLKKELNEFMGNHINLDNETIEVFKNEFFNACDFIWEHLGEKAFRNISEKDSTLSFSNSIHPAIFDSIIVASALNINTPSENFTVDNYISLLKDTEYIDCITVRTTNVEKINKRILLAQKFLFGVEA